MRATEKYGPHRAAELGVEPWITEEQMMLVERHYPLAVKMTSQLAGRFKYLHRHDIHAACVDALFRAARRFDAGRGWQFSTYYCNAAFKHCLKLLCDSPTIRVPYYMRCRLAALARDDAEAGPAVRSEGSKRPARIPRRVGMEWAEFAAIDPGEPEPEPEADRREQVSYMMFNLQRLPPLEESVLRKRFGLDGDGRIWKLREIGQHYGYTKEWVRQVEIKAEARLRELMSDQRREHARRVPGAFEGDSQEEDSITS